MGVRDFLKRIGAKAGDKIAGVSVLSPQQMEAVQADRKRYLLKMPKPGDDAAREITERMMSAVSIEIFNAFLPQIDELYVPLSTDSEYGTAFDSGHNIRYFNITKWVSDKAENSIEKLVNVYAVLSNEDCNVALVFHRTQKNTEVFLAAVNTRNDSNNSRANDYGSRLQAAIKGNFPGADYSPKDKAEQGTLPFLKEDRKYSIASASNIPTEKSEKFVSQTIEKLLDGIVPNSKATEYTIILLATPILDVEERKLKLGEFYSGLFPYASWNTDFHYNESSSASSSATAGFNIGVSAGIQNAKHETSSKSESTTDSESKMDTQTQSQTDTTGTSTAKSESSAKSTGTSEATADQHGTNNSVAIGSNQSVTAGGSVGVPFVSSHAETTVGFTENVSHGWNSSTTQTLGKTATETITTGITENITQSIAKTIGTSIANTLGRAVTKGLTSAAGIAKSISFGGNFGTIFSRSSSVTAMVGMNEGVSQTFTNFNIKHALEILEGQMKRLEQSSALGMWDFAAYVLSEDHNIANNVAHTYLALTLGEESYMSRSAINLWKSGEAANESEQSVAKEIFSYLRDLRHPVFGLNPNILNEDNSLYEYPSILTATTSLSGKELAYSLNFPSRSIAGIPVLECAAFGRNVVTYTRDLDNNKIMLGKIFHMNSEENVNVPLSKRSLASHTFVTGSTGSGKSNAIFHIIDDACGLSNRQGSDVHFLIIEPAKGEYKKVFGGHHDVSVYCTNPGIAPLLRIDPFSFPENIHVLEHLDRLIEIFNVCWPMYAAMPSVLKKAVECSYADCGWDLLRSKNKYGERIYPSFGDVARNIKQIIDSSEYDSDNKGAYKGSLLTRLQSLTSGINGMIFVADEISSEDLFDKNVIVDLSRVGSSETKSLIMGMLVQKLQEYRMANAESMNADLKHITVLEEAHNLLRRTSTEQYAESSNLQGKSVEMLSNAIAEMRTYGEGFIIADQAPGLMDMSVIRNTNTKIIMRLPDQGDRELVGRAANLNDDQISELTKLPCGVAAVYQNEWVQPVLCRIKKYEPKDGPFEYEPTADPFKGGTIEAEASLLDCIMNKQLDDPSRDKSAMLNLKRMIVTSQLDSSVKSDFMEYIAAGKDESLEKMRRLIFDFLSAENAIRGAQSHTEIREWTHSVVDRLSPSIKEYTPRQIDLALAMVLYEFSLRDAAYNSYFTSFTDVYRRNRGVY